MTGRLPNWDTRFSEYLAAARADVRAGKRNLCGLFAAGSVEAITGENPATQFRGHYREVADNLEAVVSGLFAEIALGVAGRGDLAWYDNSVGVIIGGEALFIGHDRDFIRVPRVGWLRAWSVG